MDYSPLRFVGAFFSDSRKESLQKQVLAGHVSSVPFPSSLAPGSHHTNLSFPCVTSGALALIARLH